MKIKELVTKEKLTKKDTQEFLEYLNTEYFKLHQRYENFFWVSYMGDYSVDKKFAESKNTLEKFKSSTELSLPVDKCIAISDKKSQERFLLWKKFFSVWQMPQELLPLRHKIMELESKIKATQGNLDYGYIDPKTKKHTSVSSGKLSLLIGIDDDEKVRKACYEAREKFSTVFVKEYVEYVSLLNELASKLGFEDFYSYKVFTEEGMTKKELFAIFDAIYEKTKHSFDNVAKLAEGNPKMSKPWNFSYMISSDFEKEEDQYFKFETALDVWTKTFANLGVNFRSSSIYLDLLDRKGKYHNGFCHWPDIIHYKNGKRIPGRANFTCNLVPDMIGSGADAIHTLFHEGGHAAHLLNSDMQDVCINNEYSPASTAWAETQSMFMDTIFSSIEWKTRYAKNSKGEMYPFNLFERKVEKLHVFAPLGMMSIMAVMNFEKEIFETKNLTEKKVVEIAKKVGNKFSAFKNNSSRLLTVPHIYSWQSACSYHGYGLAEIALTQWREYFFKKYGYIVDNPQVGKEMLKVWKLGMSKTFPEFIKLATGSKLSPKALIKGITQSKGEIIKNAKKKIEKLKTIKNKKTNDIGAHIYLVHGKQKIADNSKGFDAMMKKYTTWLLKQ